MIPVTKGALKLGTWTEEPMMKVGTTDTAHLAVKKQNMEGRQLATIVFRVMTGLDITEGKSKYVWRITLRCCG